MSKQVRSEAETCGREMWEGMEGLFGAKFPCSLKGEPKLPYFLMQNETEKETREGKLPSLLLLDPCLSRKLLNHPPMTECHGKGFPGHDSGHRPSPCWVPELLEPIRVTPGPCRLELPEPPAIPSPHGSFPQPLAAGSGFSKPFARHSKVCRACANTWRNSQWGPAPGTAGTSRLTPEETAGVRCVLHGNLWLPRLRR